MDSAIKTNYEILKIVPVQWIIDEELKVKDPLGMEARKLELTADIFQIPRTYYQQLVDAFVRLDIHVRCRVKRFRHIAY
jgi:cell division ATPase FtsA